MTQQAAPGATPQPNQPGYTPSDQFGVAAAAQGAASAGNINQQTVANRSNQVAADGSTLNWTQDPNTGQWTQTIQGSQGNQTLQAGANATAGQAVDALNNHPLNTGGMTDLFSLSGKTPGGFNDQAYQAIMSRLNPDMDRRRAAAETQLANQGITRGSEAWTGQEDQLGRDENDARMQGILGGFQQGSKDLNDSLSLATGTATQRAGQLGEQQTLRSQPLTDYMAMRGADKAPTFGQYTTAGSATAPNFLGAAQSQYNAVLDQQNLSADQRASLNNGLFSLGGAFLNSKTGGDLLNKGGDWLSGLFGFGG